VTAHHLARIPWTTTAIDASPVVEQAILANVGHIAKAHCDHQGRYTSILTITPRWYVCLGLGIWHLRILLQARRVARNVLPPSVVMETKVRL